MLFSVIVVNATIRLMCMQQQVENPGQATALSQEPFPVQPL